MAEQELSPAQYGAGIDGARDRLIAFVESCTAEQWNAAPLEGDPRPVGVVADHVAHAYEYLAGWIRDILRGETVAVNSAAVDALNAEHAVAAAGVTRAEAAGHLRRSGAAISALVAGCTAEDLKAGDGRVGRLAHIAIRHADDHRTEIEAALAASRPGSRLPMNEAHRVVAAYWAAAERRDWATFAGLVAEQVVYEAPQTRERVRGRTAYVRFNAEGFPGAWHLEAQRIIGEGSHAASWVEFADAGDHYPGLCFFDLDEDGRIARITDFWPTQAELPASRAHLVERY